jgi:uncharacterized protein (DUF302 family)
MSYYFNKILDTTFQEAIDIVTEKLSQEGFGVLTKIDVQATLKKKLNVDFRQYMILGACNSPFAYRALQTEDKIGLMLPCNVIVQELPNNKIEIAAIDPVASMVGIEAPGLEDIAGEVRQKLKRVIDNC